MTAPPVMRPSRNGAWAVSIGVGLLTYILAAVFILVACVFVYRSFYGMRIDSTKDPDEFGVVAKEAGSGS